MNASNVEMYTKEGCVFSENAREYLQARNIGFKEISVNTTAARGEMEKRAGGASSTPQIFLDGKLIGGYQEMVESGTFERFRQ